MDGTIELITAKTGKRTITFSGRLIASGADPEREARNWVERESHRLGHSSRVIILGLGAGYHLSEIRLQFPKTKLLCLYAEAGLWEAVNSIVSIREVESVRISDPSMVLDNPLVRSFLRSGADVVTFAPGTNSALELYRELGDRLRARDPLYFADFIRRDERLRKIIPLTAIEGGEENNLISIKDLDRWASARHEGSQDVHLIKILRELVK